MDLRFYLRRFLSRLHWFLLFLAIGTVAGLTVARLLPPLYVAEAQLLYESEQIPGELAASTVRTQATENIQIIQQRILTRANLIDLANRLNIYAPRDDTAAQRLSPDEIVEDLRDRISVTVSGGNARVAQATLIRVGFRDPNPGLASAVANEIVTMILDQNVQMRTTTAGQTLDFFEQEVLRLDRELAERSTRILEFRNANQNALPDSLEFRRSQQETEQERLLQLERTEAALNSRRANLTELFETTGEVVASDEALSEEQRQLRSLRNEREQSLAILSPQNPRLRILDSRIALLEQQVAEQASDGATPTGNPQDILFSMQLADIDTQLETVAAEKARITARLAELERTINATAGNSIALATLEREFENVQIQYNQAVSSRALAETGDTIEAMSRGQRISVIEQAVTPREPSQPNRPLIAAGGIGAGAALGVGLIALLELTNRRIRRPSDLVNRLKITPIATLPYLRTRGENWRRAAVIGVAVLLVLTAIPAGLWAVDNYFRPLDQIVAQAVRAAGLETVFERLWARVSG